MNNHPVTRRALLIGAPGSERDHLRGVSPDLFNFRNFLLSPYGGSWFEDEIIVLSEANWHDLTYCIQHIHADYLFTYFTGHGYTERGTDRRMICLQNAAVPDLYLKNVSPRQLIIIDACRTYGGGAISGIPEYGDVADYFDGESPERKIFDHGIVLSPFGKVIVHGTKLGYAAEDSSSGGLFTRALLDVGTKILANKGHSICSIHGALYHAPTFLRKQNNYQEPEITLASGSLSVPFAIGIPKVQRPTRELQLFSHTINSGWSVMG